MQKVGITPAFYGFHPATLIHSFEACERLWEVAPDARIKLDPANWASERVDYLELLHRYGNKVGYIHVKEHLHHKRPPNRRARRGSRGHRVAQNLCLPL